MMVGGGTLGCFCGERPAPRDRRRAPCAVDMVVVAGAAEGLDLPAARSVHRGQRRAVGRPGRLPECCRASGLNHHAVFTAGWVLYRIAAAVSRCAGICHRPRSVLCPLA